MTVNRRQFMQQLGALGLVAALPAQGAATVPRMIPWRNWSGGQVCFPQARVAPADEQALADVIRSASGTLRAVGSGHSFSALVPTDGTIVSLANFNGLIKADAEAMRSEFWAGTRMSDMGDPLKQAGLALPNMADIDYQTIAGAISTSTHGSGTAQGSCSTQVIGLRLITASGDAIDCDAQNHPEIFNAARVSLGALGIVTRVKLQNRKAFRLHRKEWVQNVNELMEQWPQLVKQHAHFEFLSVPHADIAIATATDETQDTRTIPKEGGGDTAKVALLRNAETWLGGHPAARAWALDQGAKLIDFPEVIDDSYKVYASVRDVRFNEMEYEVPAEVGLDCLREILARIRERQLPTYFPIEFRYVKGDDIWMSMFQGRETCSISIHQSHELDYQAYFSQIEPIFLKYGGRPHWGKLHHLGHRQLAALYPHMKDFLDVRAALDPQGKFLNEHLRSVLGVGSKS